MKQIIRNTIIFSIIGFIAGFLTATHQLQAMSQTDYDQIVDAYGSEILVQVVGGVQSLFYAAVTGFLGQLLIKVIPFELFPKWNKKAVYLAVGIGLFSGAFIVMMDALVFSSWISSSGEYQVNITYLFVGLLYGGIVEELMMRLFLLTLLVYLLKKITKNVTPTTTWIAIVISAVLFGIGHLPAATLLLGSSLPIIIRTILLNTIPGILFGYIYTKHGLTYSVIAHMMSHVFMQLVFLPLFY